MLLIQMMLRSNDVKNNDDNDDDNDYDDNGKFIMIVL